MAKPSRRRVAFGAAAAVVCVGIVASGPLWVPAAARRVDWLDVQRVEVSGALLVAPHEVLRVSGIRAGQSLFEDAETWERAVEAHPVVADARISRRLPATVRVRIVEERPVAFVGGEVLAPATAAGVVLPLDPTAVPLDLPIVLGLPSDPDDGAVVRRILAEVGRLTDLDPNLVGEISELRPAAGGEAVVLIHPRGQIVLPFGADREQILRLHAVLADLAGRYPDPAAGAARPRPTIDLRFQDQVVVRNPSPHELS